MTPRDGITMLLRGKRRWVVSLLLGFSILLIIVAHRGEEGSVREVSHFTAACIVLLRRWKEKSQPRFLRLSSEQTGDLFRSV